MDLTSAVCPAAGAPPAVAADDAGSLEDSGATWAGGLTLKRLQRRRDGANTSEERVKWPYMPRAAACMAGSGGFSDGLVRSG